MESQAGQRLSRQVASFTPVWRSMGTAGAFASPRNHTGALACRATVASLQGRIQLGAEGRRSRPFPGDALIIEENELR